MGRFHRTWVETEGKVTSLRDILAADLSVCRWNDVDMSVIPLIAFGKQQDVVKGMVEGMQVTDVFQATMLVTQNYIPVVIHILFSGSRKDGCDFIDGGQVVSAAIFALLEDYAHAKVCLELWRGLMHDLISLLVQRDKRVVGIQHVLKICHEDMIEICITGVAGGKSCLGIIDVELGIRRGATLARNQGTHLVIKSAVQPE
jgi:hypothetical protein